jgi:Domain of unknown function (DUF4350)
MSVTLGLDKRALGIGLVFAGLLALALFLAAPASNRLSSGSTWSSDPDGYAAWYDYQAAQNRPVQRWQRPVEDLLGALDAPPATPVSMPGPAANTKAATLLQIQPSFSNPNDFYRSRPWLQAWLEAGHRLVVLGEKEPVTAAPFAAELPSPAGPIRLQTRRRAALSSQQQALLKDDYGAIAWRQAEQQGHIIRVITPHLGANAYQSAAGNFAFLSELVGDGPIWVDEYLHGYRDPEAVERQAGGSWLGYLSQTPLALALAQLSLIGLIAIIAANRRPGLRQSLRPLVIDNSAAYIAALAGVLHKANSHTFVMTTLSQADRLALQKALGLGRAPVPDETLVAAWSAATGEPAAALSPLITPPAQLRRDRDLARWLRRLPALPMPAKRSPTP